MIEREQESAPKRRRDMAKRKRSSARECCEAIRRVLYEITIPELKRIYRLAREGSRSARKKGAKT